MWKTLTGFLVGSILLTPTLAPEQNACNSTCAAESHPENIPIGSGTTILHLLHTKRQPETTSSPTSASTSPSFPCPRPTAPTSCPSTPTTPPSSSSPISNQA
ncbi:hypothetical protein DFJ73DRAFT_837552 [Zopfochytrium polystomum]|nr:hypothetical protein DFJ73DRAFT_837552 [Zopfochytrium polystomum]